MNNKWSGFGAKVAGAIGVHMLWLNLACHPGNHQIAQPLPAPPPPCPAPTTTTPPPPPPPPPPKCESLDERCVSDAETQLAIGDNAASFRPPIGWHYAKETEQSIAVSVDRKAWLTFTQVESETQQTLLNAVRQLVARLEVDKVRINFLRERLNKPQHKLDTSGVITRLWEVDKKSQFGAEPVINGDEGGTVLVAVVPLSADNVLVGTAFVTTPAGETYAPLVMQSVQSLVPLDESRTPVSPNDTSETSQ